MMDKKRRAENNILRLGERNILRLCLYGGAGRKGKKERAVDATQITRTPTYKPRPTHSLSTSVNNRAEIVIYKPPSKFDKRNKKSKNLK